MVLLPALLCLAAAADSSRPDSAFQRFGGVPVLAYTGETGWQLGALGMLFLRPIGPDDPGSQVDVAAVWTTESQYRFVLNPTLAFREGLAHLGYESFPGAHPVVPLLLRDGVRTNRLVAFLREHGVLATAIVYPMVPKGQESIRFQVSADHTAADIDFVLDVLASFRDG